MKRVLLLLFVTIMTTVINAQKQHFKFLSVEIDGTVNSFADKLVKNEGFRKDAKFDGNINRLLHGTFLEMECDLKIEATKKGKMYTVEVYPKKRFTEENEKKEMQRIISLLEKKYTPIKQDKDLPFLYGFENSNGMITIFCSDAPDRRGRMINIIFSDKKNANSRAVEDFL